MNFGARIPVSTRFAPVSAPNNYNRTIAGLHIDEIEPAKKCVNKTGNVNAKNLN